MNGHVYKTVLTCRPQLSKGPFMSLIFKCQSSYHIDKFLKPKDVEARATNVTIIRDANKPITLSNDYVLQLFHMYKTAENCSICY